MPLGTQVIGSFPKRLKFSFKVRDYTAVVRGTAHGWAGAEKVQLLTDSCHCIGQAPFTDSVVNTVTNLAITY